MRTLANAQDHWRRFEQFKSLDELKSFVIYQDKIEVNNNNVNGYRSACWKAFLVTKNIDVSTWPARLEQARGQYGECRNRYLRDSREDEMDSFSDPLSRATNSPVTDLEGDTSLKNEILQDVERCMPENLYFRQPSTRAMLQDILFVWSKLNPDISYRQGMHEVLAPLVWAVERDAIDDHNTEVEISTQRDKTLLTTFDATHIEHDSFGLFTALMDSLKTAYAAKSSRGKGHTYSNSLGSVPEIVARSRKVLHEQLMAVDPQLALHLIDLDIPPQLFLMRWIRLLFGREFAFDKCIELWDCIFAEAASPACINLICVSMILRIRWQLISADHNTVLGLLLHYPPLNLSQHPAALVQDAKLLQHDPSPDTGREIVQKYTGRAPVVQHLSSTLRSAGPGSQSPMRNPGAVQLLSPPRPVHHPSNSFEVVMQNAARSVYSSGERLGVNKAVREAVGDVRKNVRSIRTDLQDRAHSRNVSAASNAVDSETSVDATTRRLDALLARNRSLAGMLESAVNELWKQHKDVVTTSTDDSVGREDEAMTSFTMAIAKVQLAQVYLEDPDLPLPDDESEPGYNPDQIPERRDCSETHPGISQNSNQSSSNKQLDACDDLARSPPQTSPGTEIDPFYFTSSTHRWKHQQSTASDRLDRELKRPQVQVSHPSPILAQGKVSPARDPLRESGSRPSLEKSSFSWMLDRDTKEASQGSLLEHGPFDDTSRAALAPRRHRNNPKTGFLFGDSDA